MTNKEKLKTPQNDFLFKKIFAKKENQGMLKELLEGILEINIKDIHAIQEVVMDKTTEEDKESRIDIQAEINDDTIINIEISKGWITISTARTLSLMQGALSNHFNNNKNR